MFSLFSALGTCDSTFSFGIDFFILLLLIINFFGIAATFTVLKGNNPKREYKTISSFCIASTIFLTAYEWQLMAGCRDDHVFGLLLLIMFSLAVIIFYIAVAIYLFANKNQK